MADMIMNKNLVEKTRGQKHLSTSTTLTRNNQKDETAICPAEILFAEVLGKIAIAQISQSTSQPITLLPGMAILWRGTGVLQHSYRSR